MTTAAYSLTATERVLPKLALENEAKKLVLDYTTKVGDQRIRQRLEVGETVY